MNIQTNPFTQSEDNTYKIPNFDQITPDHLRQALEQGLSIQQQEYKTIETNPDAPCFDNVMGALERSGDLLTLSSKTMYLLLGACNTEELNEIAQEYIPKITAHQDQLYLNEVIYEKLQVIQNTQYDDCTREEQRMLDEMINSFDRNGIKLPPAQRQELELINQKIATLNTQFRQNLLQASNQSYHQIDHADEVSQLPVGLRQQAKKLATQHEKPHAWLFQVNQATLAPFLTHMPHASHRAAYYHKYTQRCLDETDNQPLILQLSTLRLQKAKLLGYKHYAHYILENNMAGTSQSVKQLLDTVWNPALKVAKKERDQLQTYAQDYEQQTQAIQASDWWYYAEKVRQKDYAVNVSEISEYFSCEQVMQGAFQVVEQLFGLRFVEREDLPTYHEDVRVFEVQEKDHTPVGIFYADYYTRPSKQNGAWMCDLYKSCSFDGKQYPVVFNVCNFPPPSQDQPSLLTPTHIRTLFHELGHALHGLCSQTKYPMLGGTSVPRDFVELPSQILENWGLEPTIMQSYSAHYQTQASIPDQLLAQLQKAQTFNQGFANVEYCAASYLDLAWHMVETEVEDVVAFEQEILQSIHLIDEIAPRYKSNYFAHIFAGGYAAGYYAYLWAAVLDKDAYQLFKEGDLFDQKHAQNLRDYIYASGHTEHPMSQYRKLCNRDPQIEPLMRARGLKDSI